MDTILLAIAFWFIVGWVAYLFFEGTAIDLAAALGPYALEIGLTIGALALLYAGYRGYRWLRERTSFAPGDHVVYIVQKFSPRPGPRAEQVYPLPRGEGYAYVVRKPWTVVRVINDRAIEVITNGGKHHVVSTDDPHLHKPGMREWLRLRFVWHKQFPPIAG